MLSFLSALEKALVDLNQPIISGYTLFLCAHRIDSDGYYKNVPLYKQKHLFSREKGLRLLRELQEYHIIKKDMDFKWGIYRVNEIADRSADEICAIADPFCYISHLSAMSRYGLTHRLPARLSITTPHRPIWNKLREDMTEKDYGKTLDKQTVIPLRQVGFSEKIRNISVERQETKFLAKTKSIKGSFSRISGIGDTFVDMLNNPSMCGGMDHVLDVWKEHAPLYLDEIITSVDSCPIKIIKVRAGYILDELLSIRDNRIGDWVSAAQRGGSRVLNAEEPFQPKFSEKWMISLNV